MLAEGYDNSRSRQVLHLPQEQLALMLSLSRQTTNQILKDLEAQGILQLSYGGIEILDLAGLRAAPTAERESHFRTLAGAPWPATVCRAPALGADIHNDNNRISPCSVPRFPLSSVFAACCWRCRRVPP